MLHGRIGPHYLGIEYEVDMAQARAAIADNGIRIMRDIVQAVHTDPFDGFGVSLSATLTKSDGKYPGRLDEKPVNVGDLEARFLGMWAPPSYLSGCSQAVWQGGDPVLARNYDYAAERLASTDAQGSARAMAPSSSGRSSTTNAPPETRRSARSRPSWPT